MDCAFCGKLEKKSRIINESKYSFTILSNPALMKGHCLVIPKRHVESLMELSEEEKIDLLSQIIKMEKKLLEKFPGCDVRQNYRPFQLESSLKVNHLHIHLQPRTLFDELYEKCQKFEGEVFKILSEEEIEEVKNFILK